MVISGFFGVTGNNGVDITIAQNDTLFSNFFVPGEKGLTGPFGSGGGGGSGGTLNNLCLIFFRSWRWWTKRWSR